jgi:hypothetical protein
MTFAAPSPQLQPRRFSSSGSQRDHSGFVPNEWFRSDWDATPILAPNTTATFRASLAQFSDAFDAVREHDRIRIVTTTDDNLLVFISVPRGLEQSRWLVASDEIAHTIVGGVDDALNTFDQLKEQLGITKKDLFHATGIKPRTYHSWRSGAATRPRLQSVRGLWDLFDTVQQLQARLDMPLDIWFRNNRQRRSLLLSGAFDALLDLADNIKTTRSSGAAAYESGGIVLNVDVPSTATGHDPARRMKARVR